MRVVLSQMSSTQRISLVVKPPKSVLFVKEWRKGREEKWNQGKSVEVPRSEILNLAKMLIQIYNDPDGLLELAESLGYTIAGDDYDNEETNLS